MDALRVGDAVKRSEIEEDLRRYTGGSSFISTNQLRKWYGKRHEAVMELVQDIEFLQDGKSKRYFIGDVADEVKKRMEVN